MKVRLEKQKKTMDGILHMVEGLCSSAGPIITDEPRYDTKDRRGIVFGSVTTEDTESLPEEVRFPQKKSEELDHLEGLLDDKNVFASVV